MATTFRQTSDGEVVQATDGTAQPTAQKRGWPDLFVAMLLWGMVASLPLTYLVTDFPTLRLWAALWNGLLLVGLVVLYVLLSYAPSRLGEERQRARQLRVLLLPTWQGLAFSMISFTILYVDYGFGTWSTIRQLLAWLLGSTLMVALFAVRWRRKASKLEQRLGERWTSGAAFVVYFLVIFLSFLSFVVQSDASRLFKIALPAAPWQTQFSVAQEAARRLDKDAVLNMVGASPLDGWQYDFKVTLRVSWYFDTPSKKTVIVWMRDTDPEATVYAEWDSGISYQPTPLEEMGREGLLWGAVKIGLRDAFDKIVTDASRYFPSDGGKYNLQIYGRVPKDDDSISVGTGGITWEISYYAFSSTSRYYLTYKIDGQSGELVERKLAEE